MCIRDRHNGVFELVPYLLVKASYLTAQGLDLLLVAAFQNLVPDLFVAKQFGLSSHHILLHAEVGVSRRIEVLHPPLAEAAFCQLAVLGWLMAPEQAQDVYKRQIFELSNLFFGTKS